jgi:F0F1-type ATP synthase epsilon subunit
VQDQEPQSQPDASAGVVSTPDEPVTSLPEDAASDEEESEEELQRRINRIKAERERLARINELSRIEAGLETKLAAKKRKESDRGVPPI